MIKSNYIGELSPSMAGRTVVLAGWVHEVRVTAKITFLILRDWSGMAQVIGKKGDVPDPLLKAMSLPKESVISLKGTVKANKEARAGFEIIPIEITNLNPLSESIPLDVTGIVPAGLDTRLDNRHIDLRKKEPRAIFRIESTMLGSFSSYLSSQGFEQIRTPCIIAEASEGGSEVFPIKYFENKAYLAQSPQLYKQLAIIGGIEKVFMVMPVFRAEKSNTVSHINEITQMDIEMAFADQDDAIRVLTDTVGNIIKGVRERNGEDLEALGMKLEVPKARVVTYVEAIDRLNEKGFAIEMGHDFSKEHEKGLEESFGEAVVVKDFPASIRAFYSMPKEDNPELTNSFDYLYRGLEISSGAQRIHDAGMLINSLRNKGLDPKGFEFYINSFRSGAPPHSGWSIGLERFAMQITGMKNVRECSMFPRDRKRLTP